MSKSGKVIVAIVIVAVIAVGAVLVMGKKSDDKKAQNTTVQNQSSNNTSGSGSDNNNNASDVTIKYNGSSFALSANTIKSGGKVTITNESDDELELASNPHPVHTDNPELNAGDIEAHESKTITLTTKGKWGFHNHYNSSQKGEITVE